MNMFLFWFLRPLAELAGITLVGVLIWFLIKLAFRRGK